MMKKKMIYLWMMAVALMFSACNDDDKEEDEIPVAQGEYVVFAWNDLGMHCLNPTYDELVILPPYNTVNVQVVKRGSPPEIVTDDIMVEYRIKNNTFSYGKESYGGFWDHFTELFGGTAPGHDVGIGGALLSGQMVSKTDHFTIEGIPVVPVDDDGKRNPYQVMVVTVRNAMGETLASTEATVPTSDEINCAKCHGEPGKSAFEDILRLHDQHNGTQLMNNQPVLCASCHGSPVLLGNNNKGSSGLFLSEAIHKSHSTSNASCYDCHPGASTKCNRSIAHMGSGGDGNCTTCHGDMANVGSSINRGRIPWVDEPTCVSCHQNVEGVETNDVLYRNARGHGDLFCATCHGSPHAMYPSSLSQDNYQPLQLQGNKAKTIGSCGVCHENSRGDDEEDEFAEEHGGSHPEHRNACHVCHTSVSGNTAAWPHAYQWTNSNKKE